MGRISKHAAHPEECACVIGYGVVGRATSVLFGINRHFDIDPERSNISLNEVARCNLVFICLPTPISNKGYKTKSITETIKKLNKLGFEGIYIVRSTVYPGFASEVMSKFHTDRIISNPEFLSEDTWRSDIKNPPFVLLGGSEAKHLNLIKSLYEKALSRPNFIITDNISAELAKISTNSYFATKVIFANQMYDYSQKIGANYEDVKRVLESHPYGPKNHFTIIYKGKRGINGHCLPKDLIAMAFHSKLPLIRSVVRINNVLQKQNQK